MADDYDSPWKEAIERHFADFLHFYFPEAHASIDWSQPVVFLEQELRAAVHDAELGHRYVDKLVRVLRPGGEEDWVYIHLEIQGDAQEEFAERMFVYNYRLYDRYRRPVASLAVLADDRMSWRPSAFGYQVFDCQMGIRFPVVKLLDWVGREAQLDDSGNPFALITSAHLATRATRDDPAARYQAKWAVVKALLRRGWDRQLVIDLFRVIDWMMRLPKELATQFRQHLDTLEGETTMRYVTSIEALAREEGVELGMQQGMQQGIQQGRIDGKRQGLLRMLRLKFGELPSWTQGRLETAAEPALDAWMDAVLTADTIESVLAAARH